MVGLRWSVYDGRSTMLELREQGREEELRLADRSVAKPDVDVEDDGLVEVRNGAGWMWRMRMGWMDVRNGAGQR